MALGYLLEPFIQIQNVNGTPIVGAKIYVYNADTTNLATTYNDFEGHLNTNPVITDDLGNATIIADDGIEYDVSVHDENNLLLFTKKYISIDKTSSAGGTTQVAPGYGITVERVGNVFTVSVDTDLIATQDDLANKQDKLQAGANIEITNDNVVNVVNRREVVTEWPIKLVRGNNRVKFYIDDDYANQFKTKQDEVNFGGGANEVITYIAQDENGEIEATVRELDIPSPRSITEGTGIDITEGESTDTIAVDTSVVALKSEIPTLPYYIRPISISAESSSYTDIVTSTGISDFTIVGNFDTTNGTSLAITTNTSSRNVLVFIDDANTPLNLGGNGSTTVIKSISNYDPRRVIVEIFGMGIGTNIPHWKYIIYTDPYVNRMDYWIIKEQEYDGH